MLERTSIVPGAPSVERARRFLGIALTEPTTAAMLLRRNDIAIDALEQFLGAVVPEGLQERERRFVANRLRYGGYIERQERDLDRLRREERRSIPPDFDFTVIAGLSREVVEKLSRSRPANLAEAGRISGITPAALSLVNVYLEKARRKRTISGSDPAAGRRRTDSSRSAAPEMRSARPSLPDPA
jgi:tRNA uridine 5-carboxymethylaminomethyl modification enzyme